MTNTTNGELSPSHQEALPVEETADDLLRQSRFIGTFAFTLTATYCAFEAAAACIVDISRDIEPSDNIYFFLLVWNIGQPVRTCLVAATSHSELTCPCMQPALDWRAPDKQVEVFGHTYRGASQCCCYRIWSAPGHSAVHPGLLAMDILLLYHSRG